MIHKPTIIITSLGRTGTKFFQKLFGRIFLDSTCLHEPDYFNFGQYSGIKEKMRQAVTQTKESSFSNLFIRKAFGNWNVVQLSHDRVRNLLGHNEAVQKVLQQRKRFVERQSGSLYIESSSAYYGLIDVLSDVYAEHRAIYIIRDGRSWVKSKMNFGNMYKKGNLRKLVSSTWPTAEELNDDFYSSKWKHMSRFQKICWSWYKLNSYALGKIMENPHAKLFRFEDIFQSEYRYETIMEMIEFITNMRSHDFQFLPISQDLFKEKIHGSSETFPSWEQWTEAQKEQFMEICGPLMKRLGYDCA